jgi:hypothetical protein
MSMGLANAVRVARYSSADGTGIGQGEGGGNMSGGGSGSGSGAGSGDSGPYGAHASAGGGAGGGALELLAHMVGLDMVQGRGLVQGLVLIVKEGILVIESLQMLAVPIGVRVEDKPEVLGIPMLKDLVAALVMALVMLTGIGLIPLKQAQVLMAMVVAQGIVKMVTVVAVLVPELAMLTHNFHVYQSKVGAHRSPSLFEVIKLFIFFLLL